jgi:hypothetical protein
MALFGELTWQERQELAEKLGRAYVMCEHFSQHNYLNALTYDAMATEIASVRGYLFW